MILIEEQSQLKIKHDKKSTEKSSFKNKINLEFCTKILPSIISRKMR